MQTLKTSEAAALLNVSANTLRSWERRFGFPNPQRSPGRHRLYAMAEIAALRDALEEGRPISSAVSVASEAIPATASALFTAVSSFRVDRADGAMEGALLLRSLERAIEDVLLPAVDEVRRRKGPSSAAWGFASAWANDWLRRAERLTMCDAGVVRLLIGDATGGQLDPSLIYARALAVCCERVGSTVLTLPVWAAHRLSEATMVLRPNAVVIAGSHAGDEEVARWAYAVHRAAGDARFLLYHRGLDPMVAGSKRPILPSTPVRARTVLLDALAAQRSCSTAAAAGRARRGAVPASPRGV